MVFILLISNFWLEMTKKPSFSPRQYNAYKSGIIPLALIDSNFYFCKRVQYHVSKFAWDCVNPSSFLIEQWCKLSDEGLFLHRIWKEKAFFLLIRFSGSLVYEFTIVFLFSLFIFFYSDPASVSSMALGSLFLLCFQTL